MHVKLIGNSTGLERPLPVTKASPEAISAEIPLDVPTDSYELQLAVSGTTYQTVLDIVGLTATERYPAARAEVQAALVLEQPSPAILYQTDLNCGYCYWESVLAGHPTDPDHLILASVPAYFPQPGESFINVTHDGGQTWATVTFEGFDPGCTLTCPRNYFADPKTVVTPDGIILHTALVHYLAGIGRTAMTAGLFQGPVAGSSLTGPTGVDPPTTGRNFDRPLLAYDAVTGTIYVTGWITRFPSGIGLFVSRDGGQTFTGQELDYRAGFDSAPYLSSIDTMPDGALRAVFVARQDAWPPSQYQFHLLRFDAAAEQFELVPGPVVQLNWGARMSATSPRAWLVWLGPELAIDRGAESPHRGRIYLVWSQPESIVRDDPNFEWPSYGANFDIFLAYSDDDGTTWSPPRKVNDDPTFGDQVFPSIRVDSEGTVHLAFLDKRETPDEARFDVSYAKTRGARVSPNIRVNPEHVPHGWDITPIGDYLDMVVGYPEKAYVSYPCEDFVGFGCEQGGCRPADACITAVDPRAIPLENRPPQLGSLNDQAVAEGALLQFSVSATDPDGDALVLSVRLATGDPLETIGASFTDHGDGTGSFTWTPRADQSGVYEILFTASDGALDASELVTITVQEAILVVGGKITAATGSPVANITVQLRKGSKLLATTTTDTEGRYQFEGLTAGTYKLQPKRTPQVRRFSPVRRTVTLGTQNQTTLDFTAVPR